MDPVVSAALNKLVQAWGPTGAILVVCGIVIKILYSRNQDLQEKRLTESREAAFQQVTLMREFSKTVDGLTQAINSLRDIVIMAAGKPPSGSGKQDG